MTFSINNGPPHRLDASFQEIADTERKARGLRTKAEILKEAEFLVSLNEPNHGGPWMGSAAERFVTVMQELIDLTRSQI